MNPAISAGEGPAQTDGAAAARVAANWLASYSAEVTTPDRKALDAAAALMWPSAPVYIASLPSDNSDKQLEVAIRLHELGLRPVPHIVARNLRDEAQLATAVERFARLGGVDRALVLGGDRDVPAGSLVSAVQLLRSGVFEANGIHRVAIACYPEGHPKISDAVLDAALMEKLEAAEAAGLNVRLITQLCFDAAPIVGFVRRLRQRGVGADLRVGLAGPARATTLLKYAAICGVGPSLRALRDRRGLAAGLLRAVSPAPIIGELAEAMVREPPLGITGLHFFTFATLRGTIDWASEERARCGASAGAVAEAG